MTLPATPLQPTAPPFTPGTPSITLHTSNRRRAFDRIAIPRILERRGTGRQPATTRAAPETTKTSLQAQDMAPKIAPTTAPINAPKAPRAFHDVNTPTPPVYWITTSGPQTSKYVNTAGRDAVASQTEALRKATIFARFPHIDPSSWQFQREMRRLERAGRFRQPRRVRSRNPQGRNPYLNGLSATEWDESMDELPWQQGPGFRKQPEGNGSERLRSLFDSLAVSGSDGNHEERAVSAATKQGNILTERRGQQQLHITNGSEPTNSESLNYFPTAENKNELIGLTHTEPKDDFQAIVDDSFGPSRASNASPSSTITPAAPQKTTTPAPFLHPGEPPSIFDLRPAPQRRERYTLSSAERRKFIVVHDSKNRNRDVLVNSTELAPIPFQQQGVGKQYSAVGGSLKPVGIVVHKEIETGSIVYEPQPEQLVGYGVRLGGKDGKEAGEVAGIRKASYAIYDRGALACGVCTGFHN